jgi:hypothetical protein
MSEEDTADVVKVFETYKPVFDDHVDRSKWSEKQWQEEKEKEEKRKENIERECRKVVEDKEKLEQFFKKLTDDLKAMVQLVHKNMVKNLKAIATKSGLSDEEFNRFVKVFAANHPHIHWRPIMHPNEKVQAMVELKSKWNIIKNKTLAECEETEVEKYEDFFKAVEADFKRHSRHHHHGHHGKNHRFHPHVPHHPHHRRGPATAESSEEERPRPIRRVVHKPKVVSGEEDQDEPERPMRMAYAQ